jgi:DNA-binding transcriptional ArsR family regulator
MPELDSVIHQPARLQIMAALSELIGSKEVDFTFLRTKIGLTDGNLGAHLLTLEEAGYIKVKKTFVGRRPKTFLAITAQGRKAFESHVAALEAIIKPGRSTRQANESAKPVGDQASDQSAPEKPL